MTRRLTKKEESNSPYILQGSFTTYNITSFSYAYPYMTEINIIKKLIIPFTNHLLQSREKRIYTSKPPTQNKKDTTNHGQMCEVLADTFSGQNNESEKKKEIG